MEEERPNEIRVYLAGKIAKNDWRHELFPDLRGAAKLSGGYILNCDVLRGDFRYTGPYFISCDHGCAHREGSHGIATYEDEWGGHGPVPPCCFHYDDLPSRGRAVRDSFGGIRDADVVFAWLDDLTAYGTMCEIGFAVGIECPVWLYYGDGIIPETPDVLPCWFPVRAATKAYYRPTATEAWAHFEETFPWTVELGRRDRWGSEKAQSYLRASGRFEPRAFTKGVVYVLRAGQYYKIGKAARLDRRLKQLALQLPERADLIHAIEADHAYAAEAYYHAAFQDLRLNGEWFKLEEKHLKWLRETRSWNTADHV